MFLPSEMKVHFVQSFNCEELNSSLFALFDRSHSDSSCWSLTRYSTKIHNETLAATVTDIVHGLSAIAAAIVEDTWPLWSFVLH